MRSKPRGEGSAAGTEPVLHQSRGSPIPRTPALPHSRTPALPHSRTPALPHYPSTSHATCPISGAMSFSQASWTAAGEPGREKTTRPR